MLLWQRTEGISLADMMEELEAKEVDRSTHFVFEHKVFSVEGSYFSALNVQNSPFFYIPMGDAQAAVPLHSLRDEFNLASGSPDARLLDVVEKSLRHVRQIRPFDSIPCEVLDGTASWSVEEQHHMIANGRITAQLVSWIAGKEQTVVDLQELQHIVSDPLTKERLQDAFNEIADQLGIGRENKHRVVDRIGHLVNELSYVEALRDKFREILVIGQILKQLTIVYHSEASVQEEVVRALELFRMPAAEYSELFASVDQETKGILEVLKEFEFKVKRIRAIRDQLHFKFSVWEEYLEDWNRLGANSGPETVKLIRDTYRFLAQRYTLAVEW